MCAAVVEVREELLDASLVAGLGGADVVVVGDAHALPEGAELGGDLVGELLRRDAGGCGGALDLLAVLVGAGEERGVVAEEAVAAGDDVGGDGGVGVADVGARVDVVDRGGEIELFLCSGMGGQAQFSRVAELRWNAHSCFFTSRVTRCLNEYPAVSDLFGPDG